ncbi:MAG: magnesium/cobalt transporter CorA [Pseudomonadota bacterium]|nr:magnesium/cobalt transporter CorA [Pseudomonadota bacterium]
MITSFAFEGSLLKRQGPLDGAFAGPPVWVDLLNPDMGEIQKVDTAFGLDLPTLEEMREIETSSRLYEEGGTFYMTVVYVADSLGDQPDAVPLTFVLKEGLLLTIRYREMRIIKHLTEKAESKGLSGSKTNSALMALILESIVDLSADALEKNHMTIETQRRKVFDDKEGAKDYKQFLRQIAKIDELNSMMRESLVSLSRLHSFLLPAFRAMKADDEAAAKLHTLTADVHSLLDHAAFISNKTSFLLDATLGLVNIEQNAIIKIFSVAAVIFLPPTLVASIYGMNFKIIPELSWTMGYPFALVLMILSAVLPYVYFKRRGWL